MLGQQELNVPPLLDELVRTLKAVITDLKGGSRGTRATG